MRDNDVLDNNPYISRSALEAIHEQVFAWALSRSGYDRAIAEDLVQQAYVELLTGRARFEERSSLRTFVFGVVQNLANSRFRRVASRMRLLREFANDSQHNHVQATEPDENRELWQAVQQLPQRQRDIVELVFCRDMSIATGIQRHRCYNRHWPRSLRSRKKSTAGQIANHRTKTGSIT